MEQFQKFQNLNELEGDSIQERLREIKELLIMFGIPWYLIEALEGVCNVI